MRSGRGRTGRAAATIAKHRLLQRLPDGLRAEHCEQDGKYEGDAVQNGG